MTKKEAIFELIKYRRRLEEDSPIDAEPFDMAIEALERKKGRWTKKEEYLDTPTVCTLCGHEYVEYVEGWEWEETGDLPNYCPNCGADMQERREEHGN